MFTPYVLTEYQVNRDQFPIKNIILNRKPNSWYEPVLHKTRSWLAGKVQREFFFKNFYINSLKLINPDVVHIHFGVPGLLLSSIIKKLRFPLLTSFYGTDLSKIPFLLGKNVYEKNYLFENGQIFTAEGNQALGALTNLGCPKEKAELLRIGIDFQNYKFINRTKKEDEPLKILFCGRFIEKKGLKVAVKSVSQSIRMGNNIKFNIIGDGPQKEEIKKLVNELGLDKHVNFYGILKHKEFIKECYNNHLMIVPSQVDKKTKETEGGAPTVLIEAQATGLPIIATDHADIPEIVIKDKSGFIVREGDIEAMSQSINKIYSNSVLLGKMGIFGRNHVKKQHDMKHINYRLEKLYKLAIEKNTK